MRREDLETFTTVAECGTLAAAAERLFITQGTASERIRSLESEIGKQLIIRHRGVRSVSLTPAGTRLVPIASSILALMDEAAQVDDRPPRRRLVVAAADSLNGKLLVDFYRAFIAAHPDILLELKTSMYHDVNRQVEERAADVGLTFALERYPNIVARELFWDHWAILCRADSAFAQSGDPADLAGADEVRMHYATEQQLWQSHHLPGSTGPRVIVGNAAYLTNFMDTEGSWCFAPLSVARPLLERRSDLVMRRPPEEPPARIARILTHRMLAGEHAETVALFERELKDYLGKLDLPHA